jgi:mRNA interferase RelE/StbE
MQVLVEKQAAKYLERLNEPVKGRIIDALEKLGNEPPEGDIRKLQGQETAFRLRVGDFRGTFGCFSSKSLPV